MVVSEARLVEFVAVHNIFLPIQRMISFIIFLIKIQREALKGSDSLSASAIQFAVLSWLRQRQLTALTTAVFIEGEEGVGRGDGEKVDFEVNND